MSSPKTSRREHTRLYPEAAAEFVSTYDALSSMPSGLEQLKAKNKQAEEYAKLSVGERLTLHEENLFAKFKRFLSKFGLPE
jgi:hypothetical protein